MKIEFGVFKKSSKKAILVDFSTLKANCEKNYAGYPKTDTYFCSPYRWEYSVKISGQSDANCERSRILGK